MMADDTLSNSPAGTPPGSPRDPRVGAHTEQNDYYRRTQEDRCVVKVTDTHLVLAVFDGHGGEKVANEAMRYLMEEGILEFHLEQTESPKEALEMTFVQLAQQFEKSVSGSTAVVVIVINKTVYIANLGDSRVVVYYGAEIVHQTKDHKMTPEEIKGVEERGGSVVLGRVQGVLAIPRAFGNNLKGVGTKPDITVVDATFTHIVLASDGVWDVVQPEQVGSIIVDCTPTEAAKKVCQKALAAGSRDNCTCVVYKP